MKNLFRLLPILALVCATSCNSHEDDTVQKEPIPEAVSFTAKVKQSTRATDLQFEDGDQISVFATTTGAIDTENYAQNVCYEYAENLFSTKDYLSYPSASEDLTFYAVYPYDDYSTPEFNFDVQLDQQEHSAYTASDLMTSSAVGNNNKVVDLVFSHRLSKIVLNVSSEQMPAGDLTAVFKNVKYRAAVNLNNNTYHGVEGVVSDVIASPNGTNSFKILLPAQGFSAGTLLAEITVGDKTFKWTLDQDIVLNSGVEYVYNVELKDNVVFTAQINPWGTPEEIESVIPDEYLELLEPYIPIHKGATPPNVEGVYFISPYVLVTDNVGYTPGHIFTDAYLELYNQTAENRISIRKTQLLGDLDEGEGLFISGEGEDFTIYYNGYSTHEDGSWLTQAAIISGSIRDGKLLNYNYAFVILDSYDTVDQYMDAGEYRILCDQDGVSEPTTWPLETRAAKVNGLSIYTNKK